MLSYNEFIILRNHSNKLKRENCFTVNIQSLNMSKDEYLVTINLLEKKNYIANGCITAGGLNELEYYKVNNAVILAAGSDQSVSKQVFSLPKGLFKIGGTPIIERQIEQLIETGITNISIVVGIRKEYYFYLEDKYDINIISTLDVNKNNIVSLYSVKQYLGSTYILNCDNYFESNPFELYEYDSFHAVQKISDISHEYAVQLNSDKRITQIYVANNLDNLCLYGHAYFSKKFSERFVYYLEKEINNFRVDSLHWQEFYAKHITDLDLYVKIYCDNFISEFDSILQAQEFDSLFIYNVSETSINKITEVLNCSKEDIKNIKLTPKGLSNFITTFDVNEQKYILRFPGTDSDVIFERKKEVITQKYAHIHGIDNVLVYIDESGIKISKFVENCEDIFGIYYKDMDLMLKLVDKVTKLHNISLLPEEKKILHFEPLYEADKLLDSAALIKQDAKSMFINLRESVHNLYIYLEKDGYAPVLCHNDINPYNILVSKTTFELIDYEFAGYCDPAYDFGRIIDGYDFKDDKIDILLERYFGKKPNEKDRMHWIGYIAIHAWYYFCWSLYKESIGLDAIHWMHYFYNRIKSVIKFVMPYYNKNFEGNQL